MDEADQVLKSRVEFTRPPAGSNLARELLNGIKKNANRTLLVDAQSGCELTGADVLARTGAIATGLVRQVGLKPNDVVMNLCDRDVTEALVALGALFAGGALYPALVTDGYKEIEVLCELTSPQVIVTSREFCEHAQRLRQNVPGCRGMKIVLIDTQQQQQQQQIISNSTHSKLLYDANNNEIVQNDEIYSLAELEASNVYDAKLIESIVHEQIVPQEHVATYMLTSGSTGRPKVVPSTHEELVYGLYSMLSAAQNPFPSHQQHDDENNNNNNNEQQQPTYLVPLKMDDVVSGDLPLDHGAGINIMFLSLCVGSKFIVMPSYDVDIFWRIASDHRVTFSLSSTTFGYNLFKRLKELIDTNDTERYDLSCFRWLCVCGAKMAYANLVYEVLAHARYKHLQVCQAYGCTENGFISVGLGREVHTAEYLDSTGYLFPGLVAKVVDYGRIERTVARGERGELLIWSRSLFKRYISSDKDHASAARIYANCHDSNNVFYRTGDQAHLDPAGRLYLHGRFKDTLVLMSDWKVLPAELEEVLNEHPLIEISVVVGMPDPELPGCHAPRAFVQLISRERLEQLRDDDEANQNVDLRELMARMDAGDLNYISRHIYEYFAERTAREKHLRGGVRVLDEFPRVGLLRKIDRKALLLMD